MKTNISPVSAETPAHNEKELLPCPFCGNSPKHIATDDGSPSWTWCSTQGCPAWDRHVRVTKWNQRAHNASLVSATPDELQAAYNSGVDDGRKFERMLRELAGNKRETDSQESGVKESPRGERRGRCDSCNANGLPEHAYCWQCGKMLRDSGEKDASHATTLNPVAEDLLREIMKSHSDSASSAYNECDKSPCMWCRQAAELLSSHSNAAGVPELDLGEKGGAI